MDVGPPLVAHLEPAEAIEPRQRALDYPAIPSQPLARFAATARDAGDDAACAQGPSTARIVIAFVRVELRGTLARSTSRLVGEAKRWDRIDRFLQQPRIMHVGPGHGHRQRQAHAVEYEVPLGAQLAAIGRILARRFAPREPVRSRCRVTPAPNRFALRLAAAAAAPGGGVARRRLAASRAGAASTSSCCHSPSPGAAVPRGCRSSRRTECP